MVQRRRMYTGPSKGRLYFCAGGWGWCFRRLTRWEPWTLYALLRGDRSRWELQREVELREYNLAKKPEIISSNGSPTASLKAGSALSKFPTLRSYLIDTVYEGTTDPREPSFLIVRPSRGTWFITLKDPTTGLQIRTNVESYDMVLPALEALLTAPAVPWEVDPFHRPSGASKRRK